MDGGFDAGILGYILDYTSQTVFVGKMVGYGQAGGDDGFTLYAAFGQAVFYEGLVGLCGNPVAISTLVVAGGVLDGGIANEVFFPVNFYRLQGVPFKSD